MRMRCSCILREASILLTCVDIVLMVRCCNSLPTDRGYLDLNRDISVCSMPLTHGITKTGSVYESSAYFLRNNVTERELLFFGDVEPDSISSKPQTINVWKTAAPKIPHTLTSIFIECSWTSDRPDHLLFGHLNPVHLVDELVALALEVYKVKNNLQSTSVVVVDRGARLDTRARKKKKFNPIPLESLRGILDGVTVYIMHCKSDLGGKYDVPISQVIGAEVRDLIQEKELGMQVVVLEQGTRIREFCSSTQDQKKKLTQSQRSKPSSSWAEVHAVSAPFSSHFIQYFLTTL